MAQRKSISIESLTVNFDHLNIQG